MKSLDIVYRRSVETEISRRGKFIRRDYEKLKEICIQEGVNFIEFLTYAQNRSMKRGNRNETQIFQCTR